MQTRRLSFLGAAAISAIKCYRKLLSNNILHTCRFLPSCSVYAEESIFRYGAFRGALKTVGRLLRCHPFCAGGYDPVQ